MSKIINFARRQVGLPYVFGASGPKGFDCFGLTIEQIKEGPTGPFLIGGK
jgi:hypothetical protein